jgi:hypothetical protein
MTPPEDPLARLHRDLGLKPLNPLWAKAEILIGLFVVATGLVVGMRLATDPAAAASEWIWLGPVLLITLGGYLALAGHRSHLYQSNNRLAAYLADLIRAKSPPQNTP